MGFVIDHYEHNGTLNERVSPENLRFTLTKNGVHTIQYEISHQEPSVAHDFVGAYRTDFRLSWVEPSTLDETIILAGLHVPAPTTAKGSAFTTIYGKDWKHYLERRHFPFDPTDYTAFSIGTPPLGLAAQYAATDVTVIMKDLLDTVLGMPHSLAMTYPTLTTAIGLPVDFQLAKADTSGILTFIDTFSQIDPGFDYEVLYTKEFRIYSPHKYNVGVVSDSSLANCVFDSTNSELITDGPSFINNGPAATHWLAVGDGIGQSRLGVALGAPAVETVYRRLDGSANYSEMKKLSDLRNRAMKDFSFALNPQHEIQFSVQAEHIADFWTLFEPGTAIWLDNELVSHQIQSAQEIVQMDCTADNRGGCTVVFGLNQIYSGTAGVDEA